MNTPDPTISVRQARDNLRSHVAGTVLAGGFDLDRHIVILISAVRAESASALVQAAQARDEARQERDKHLQAIGPAYQAGFVQAQRDLLARVRGILVEGHPEPRVRAVWGSMRRHLLAKIDELADPRITPPTPQ